MFKIGFLVIELVDIIDIILVTILIYQVFKLIRGSVAFNIFIGFLAIYITYLLLAALELKVSAEILGKFMGVGILALIILFQQEIRRFLQLIGGNAGFEGIFSSNPLRILKKNARKKEDIINVNALVDALKIMSKDKTGALIILSIKSELKYYAEAGEPINAPINKRLLVSIFNKYSPLHDGAVIIYKDMISSACCVLPLTQNPNIPYQFGTRHRAALGMSEFTEALIIVASEETGGITFVQNNRYRRNVPLDKLKTQINKYIKQEPLDLMSTLT